MRGTKVPPSVRSSPDLRTILKPEKGPEAGQLRLELALETRLARRLRASVAEVGLQRAVGTARLPQPITRSRHSSGSA